MAESQMSLMGKVYANVYTNSSVGEGTGVNVFEMGRNVSIKFKTQVCYRT